MMTKTRRAAALIGALCAAGGMLAACGGSHKAADASVVLTRPAGPSWQTDRLYRFAPPRGPKEKDFYLHSGHSRPIVGTSRYGCNPLPKPIGIKNLDKALASHPMASLIVDALPKTAQGSVVFVTTRSALGHLGSIPGYTLDVVLRGVPLGEVKKSGTATVPHIGKYPYTAIKRYRVGPGEPGLLLDVGQVEEIDGRWVPFLTFGTSMNGAVTLAKC